MDNTTIVIMIPALNCNGKLFADQIIGLKAKGYTPIVMDNTKHGTNKEFAQFVLKKAPDKFHLVGLSMGGYAAFEILRQQPDRVEKVVLMATTARSDTAEKKLKRTKVIDKVVRGNFTAVTDELWQTMVSPSRVSDKRLHSIYREMSEEIGSQGFLRQMAQVLSRGDFRENLRHIKSETLVIVGDQDQRSPLSIAQEIAEEINAGGYAKARVEVIKNAGHFCSLEQPKDVTKLIVGFLCGPTP